MPKTLINKEKIVKKTYTFILALTISGCGLTDPQMDMKAPAYVEQIEPKTENSVGSLGSLFGKGSNPLFSDNKAMNVNDIVTIIIKEDTTQSSKASKSTNKSTNSNLNAGVFSGLLSTLNKNTNIGFNTKNSSDFSGSGQASRNENFQTTISARVIKVLANGNYFIEGKKQILVNGEKQIVQISGVIRPYDISGQNTIESKYIADAKILYSTQGEIDKATKKPWGTKAVETVWPF